MLLDASKEGAIRDIVQVLKVWDKDKFNINEPNEVWTTSPLLFLLSKLLYCWQEGKPALILAAERNYGIVVVALLESELGIDIDFQTEVSNSHVLSKMS